MLRVPLSWPDPALSPNGRAPRRIVFGAVKAAKDEAYWSLLEAMPRAHAWRSNPPQRIFVGIHCFPAVKRGRDDDNMIASLKPHRDGLARALKVDDVSFVTCGVRFAPPVRSINPHLILNLSEEFLRVD